MRIRNVGGKIIEYTKGKNISFAKENIVYNSNKKISFTAENGVFFDKPETPKLTIVPSEYKLESTYAHEQFYSLAYELAEMPFMFLMLEVFGHEIEISALSKLYRDLSDKIIKPPEIIVSKIPVNGKPAGYSNIQKKIIVFEKFIDDAIKDNDKRAELLAALVEEYGHHIDNLLRTELATNGIKDEDIIDEGAKFAYALFKFDIFKESSLKFAQVETPNYSGDLIVDFSELHNDIKTYVSEREQYDEIPGAETPNYGAGRNRKKDKSAAYAHGDIEFEALADPKSRIFSNKEVYNIYYGNWLRDFSQVIVQITVRATNAAVNSQKYKIIEEAMPMKLSHKAWVDLMEVLAIKEFIYDPLKDEGKEPVDDYNSLKKSFDKNFGGLTKDILGIYRPEEHIDNPKGLPDESKTIDEESKKVISFNDDGIVKYLYKGDNNVSWDIDKTRNMSNFFWIDYPDRPSTVTYMKSQFKLACKHGKTPKGLKHLGAALHVLEDFFAHTNFVEISLKKQGADVYPWIQDYKNKKWEQLPLVSGTFLTADTIASVGPKVAALLYDPKFKDYKRRKPKQRPLAEEFILKTLKDLAKGQKSDTAKKNSTYLGIEYATWLAWFQSYLDFQEYLAVKFEEGDKMKWDIKEGPEKAGIKALETVQKSMNYVGQAMTFFPKLIVNIILGSFDNIIPEAQSHLNTNYGNSPSHSQLAKDSYEHPLNKLSAEMAKIAVKDVGTKFFNGIDGQVLADYVANTYFVHPEKSTKFDTMIRVWKDTKANKGVLEKLKSATIFEHVHEQAKKVGTFGKKTPHSHKYTQDIDEKTVNAIEEIMNYFKDKK
jgi:hypothetical protein